MTDDTANHLAHNRVFVGQASTEELDHFRQRELELAETARERYDLFPTRPVFQLRETDLLSPVTTDAGQPGTDVARAVLSALDEPQSLRVVCDQLAPHWSEGEIRSAAEAMLGQHIETGSLAAELERNLPRHALVRFPAQPTYSLSRAYWENSITVRRALPLLYEKVHDRQSFAEALAGLHRLATMGESGDNVYGGPGGTPTPPGQYRNQLMNTWAGRPTLEALRQWLRALDLPINLVTRREVISPDGAPMVQLSEQGRFCLHLCDREDTIVPALVDEARRHLACAIDGDREHLAYFIQVFAATHPFYNINFSIAMNIANDLLQRMDQGQLPHLYIDYLAQRTRADEFASAFTAIVKRYRFTGDPESKVDVASGSRCDEFLEIVRAAKR